MCVCCVFLPTRVCVGMPVCMGVGVHACMCVQCVIRILYSKTTFRLCSLCIELRSLLQVASYNRNLGINLWWFPFTFNYTDCPTEQRNLSSLVSLKGVKGMKHLDTV